MEVHRLLVRVLVWLGHLLILAGASAGATIAWRVLTTTGAPLSLELPQLFPFATMALTIDGLAAFFLLVIALVAAAAAVYGPAYLGTHAKAPLLQTAALGGFVAFM